MSAKILLLLFAGVSLASVSQIVLKTSLSQPHVTLALDGGSYVNAAPSFFPCFISTSYPFITSIHSTIIFNKFIIKIRTHTLLTPSHLPYLLS